MIIPTLIVHYGKGFWGSLNAGLSDYFSLFGIDIPDFEDLFKKFLFFFSYLLEPLVSYVHGLIFKELVDYCIQLGHTFVYSVEYSFSNVNSLEFLYYIFGLAIVVFCIKLLVKIVGAFI